MLKNLLCLGSFCLTVTHGGVFVYTGNPAPQFASADLVIFEEPIYEQTFIGQPWFSFRQSTHQWNIPPTQQWNVPQNQQWNMPLHQQWNIPPSQQWNIPQQNSFAVRNFQPFNSFPVYPNPVVNRPFVNGNQVPPAVTNQIPPPNTNPVTTDPTETIVMPSPVDIQSQ